MTVNGKRIIVSSKCVDCPMWACRYEDEIGEQALRDYLRDVHFIDVVAEKEQKRQLIKQIVDVYHKERASLRDLADRFNISSTTVRRYLKLARRLDEPRQMQLFR